MTLTLADFEGWCKCRCKAGSNSLFSFATARRIRVAVNSSFSTKTILGRQFSPPKLSSKVTGKSTHYCCARSTHLEFLHIEDLWYDKAINPQKLRAMFTKHQIEIVQHLKSFNLFAVIIRKKPTPYISKP